MKDEDTAHRFGQTAPNMRVSGRATSRRAMAKCGEPMEMCMKDSGNQTIAMGMANSLQ